MEEDRKTRKEEDQPRRANTEIQYPRMTDQRNREGKSTKQFKKFPQSKGCMFSDRKYHLSANHSGQIGISLQN